jgi:type III restriction enzyme
MLTEGWDANTVTHILGVRAFGTQLLCEQVVGRGLRRRSYEPDENGFFSPEYADVYGVPFSFIPTAGKGGGGTLRPTRSVHALPERKASEISFPRIAGYRLELPDEPLYAEFSERSRLTVTTDIPTETQTSGLIGATETQTLDKYRPMREQEVAYGLAHRVLALFDEGRDPRPWYFPQVLAITKRWLREFVKYQHGTFPGLLTAFYEDDAVRIILGSLTKLKGQRNRIVMPIFRAGERTGSTADVDFITTKEVFPTGEKCHVNFVPLDGIDGNTWEKSVAEILETMPEVAAYVKNDRLGFTVPYSMYGRSHEYIPDFLVRLVPRAEDDPVRTLIVEVSGTLKNQKVTAEKANTTRELWLPAINGHGGFGHWDYCELTEPAKFRSGVATAIKRLYEGPFYPEPEGTLDNASA